MERKEVEDFACVETHVFFSGSGGNERSLYGVILFGDEGILIADGANIYGDHCSTEQDEATEEKMKLASLIPYDRVRGISHYAEIPTDCVTRYEKLTCSFVSYDPKRSPKKDLSLYPHICPICGAPAYCGLLKIDCSKHGDHQS
jgi:hypothetical protein